MTTYKPHDCVVITTYQQVTDTTAAALEAAGASRPGASIRSRRRDCDTGLVVEEQWREASSGACHRQDGPAVIMRDPDTGIVVEESWYLVGRLSRDDGPAVILRNPNTGMPVEELWYSQGRLHRKNGPAIIRWDDSGKVKFKRWYSQGRWIPYRERMRGAIQAAPA